MPPGITSSHIWSLKPGDRVTISGPFGEFFANETDAEMVPYSAAASDGADAFA